MRDQAMIPLLDTILVVTLIVIMSGIYFRSVSNTNETLSSDNAKLTKDNKELLRAINSMNTDVDQMIADGMKRETAERLKADGCLLVLDYN